MGHQTRDPRHRYVDWRTQCLLDSLMVLARSQQALPRHEPVDLAAAARTAAATTAPEAHARGVDVSLDLQPARLEADPPLVERLVGNLVENGIRHNEPGGRVQVTTRPGLVRVENTGRAIAPDDVRRLAEPFERLGRDSDGPGAGLGLSIVRTLVTTELLGTIDMTRADPGTVVALRMLIPETYG